MMRFVIRLAIVMELIRALSISLVLSPKFGILVACVIRQFV